MFAYFEGKLIVENLSLARTKNELVNYTLSEQAELMVLLAREIEDKTSQVSPVIFTIIFKKFVAANDFSMPYVAKITGIGTGKRVAQLAEGALPTQRELLQLTLCESFLKDDGTKWTLEELTKLIGKKMEQ